MPRSIRHLLAATLAVAGLVVAVLPTFAADQPVLTGTVVDATGQPFPVENGTLTMTAPDGGGIFGTQVSVSGDGSFEVEVMPWGTDAVPAEVTISVTGVGTTETNASGCTDQFAPVAESTFQVALESGGEPEPVALVAAERLVATVCGAGSSPGITLPPSEVQPSEAPASQPPAVVEPVTPAPSTPLLVLEPVTPADEGGLPAWLLPAIAVALVVVIALGAWRMLAGRSRA